MIALRHKIGVWRASRALHRADFRGAILRAWFLCLTQDRVGDYVEFGVWRGDSLIAAFLAQRAVARWLAGRPDGSPLAPWPAGAMDEWRRSTPHIIGFDTFAGMPQNAESSLFAGGSFATSEAAVRARCARWGLTAPTLHLHPGLFAETAAPALTSAARPISILHIDCDLYASTVDALTAAEPWIGQGTIVLADDWNLFAARADQGERRAFAEAQSRANLNFEPWFAYGIGSQAFLVHRAGAGG